MDKVLVVVITADYVKPQCWDAIINQDYPHFDFLIHVRKPKIQKLEGNYPEPTAYIIKKYINCTDNREVARKISLASDADRFLFVDSDIVIPRNAITEMVKQPFDVQGGYYKVANDDRYTCGRWVDDNQFWNLRFIENHLVKVDMVGMGCAMFSRKALEAIIFEHGTDKVAFTYLNGIKVPMLLGECGVLGNLLQDKGFELYANGSVVCDHLV